MAVLKKVKATTLMETMVATVLIVVIFMIASLLLNSIFSKHLKNNTQYIKEYLYELEYQTINQQLLIPYYEDYKGWEISISKDEAGYTIFAEHPDTKKELSTLILYDE